ncbi:MAG: class I SAM-dependent methyltransferase [Bacteroidota bacterium]
MISLKILNRIGTRRRILPPREAYELWAKSYDRTTNPLLFLEEEHVIPLVRDLTFTNASVVDFGCGTGRYLKRFLSQGATLAVGVDFSRKMLTAARRKFNPNEVSLVEGNLANLPLRSEMFEIGISTLVLGYLPEIERPIAEMCRVVMRRGVLLISEFHPVADSRGWKRTFAWSSGQGRRRTFAVRNYAHPVREYIQEFENNGMEVEFILQPQIDDSMRPFFVKAGLEKEYAEALGTPILFILKLRKR